jgi:uncharacterized protein
MSMGDSVDGIDGILVRDIPQPTPESEPFWEAAARGELAIQRCNACERFWFPPSNRCQSCWSDDVEWRAVSGRAELYTFTVYRRGYSPALKEQLPYVVGIVELEEGPRLVTNIVGCEPEDVRVGMSLRVTFRDIGEGFALHGFEPQ